MRARACESVFMVYIFVYIQNGHRFVVVCLHHILPEYREYSTQTQCAVQTRNVYERAAYRELDIAENPERASNTSSSRSEIAQFVAAPKRLQSTRACSTEVGGNI